MTAQPIARTNHFDVVIEYAPRDSQRISGYYAGENDLLHARVTLGKGIHFYQKELGYQILCAQIVERCDMCNGEGVIKTYKPRKFAYTAKKCEMCRGKHSERIVEDWMIN